MKRALFSLFFLGFGLSSVAEANEQLWLACQRLPVSSLVEQCYSSLNAKYFQDGVIQACDRLQADDKFLCLQTVADQAYKPKNIEKCAKKKKPQDVIKCFRSKGKDDLPGQEQEQQGNSGSGNGGSIRPPVVNTYVSDLPESDGVCSVRKFNQSVELSSFYRVTQQAAASNRRCLAPQILGRARSAMLFDANGTQIASERGLLTGAEAESIAASFGGACEAVICELQQ